MKIEKIEKKKFGSRVARPHRHARYCRASTVADVAVPRLARRVHCTRATRVVCPVSKCACVRGCSRRARASCPPSPTGCCGHTRPSMNALMGQNVLNKHVLRNTLRFYSSRVSLSSSKQVSEAGAVLLAAGPTTFWRPSWCPTSPRS